MATDLKLISDLHFAVLPGPRESPTVAAKYPTPSEWTGHNRKLGEYFLAQGYPAYDQHPRYLGELHGSWSQIGKQYGERAGDLIRLVSRCRLMRWSAA